MVKFVVLFIEKELSSIQSEAREELSVYNPRRDCEEALDHPFLHPHHHQQQVAIMASPAPDKYGSGTQRKLVEEIA